MPIFLYYETVNNCSLITFSMLPWFYSFIIFHISHLFQKCKASSYSFCRNCSVPLIILLAFLCIFSSSEMAFWVFGLGEHNRLLHDAIIILFPLLIAHCYAVSLLFICLFACLFVCFLFLLLFSTLPPLQANFCSIQDAFLSRNS